MWSIDPPPQWVGRGEELAVVRAGVEALSRGEGALIWVEGEPGIGKSSLVAEALAAGSAPGWDIGWGIAGQLTERLPLRVMLDCLQVRPGSPDPRRAHAADLLRSLRQGLFADGDVSVTGIEVLVGLVDELSAAAPTVIVLDDLQWADDASLIVWHQLAASIGHLRLLLIGTCRPAPRRPEVQELRAAVIRHGGAVVTLGPLTETDVTARVTAMLGSPLDRAPERSGPGVPSPADPAGALREHARRAAYGAARRGGPGTRRRGRGRAERRAAAVRREQAGRGLGPDVARRVRTRAGQPGPAGRGRDTPARAGRDARWRRSPGRAHGQPGLGPARRRVLPGGGQAGQPGADGDDEPDTAGRDRLGADPRTGQRGPQR